MGKVKNDCADKFFKFLKKSGDLDDFFKDLKRFLKTGDRYRNYLFAPQKWESLNRQLNRMLNYYKGTGKQSRSGAYAWDTYLRKMIEDYLYHRVLNFAGYYGARVREEIAKGQRSFGYLREVDKRFMDYSVCEYKEGVVFANRDRFVFFDNGEFYVATKPNPFKNTYERGITLDDVVYTLAYKAFAIGEAGTVVMDCDGTVFVGNSQ